MSEVLMRTLPDLSIMVMLGCTGFIAILYGASGSRKGRRTTFIVTGIVLVLLAAYLVAAYLYTGPGRALLS